MKTAISVDDQLLENVDQVARDLGISRSKLFAVAAANFLQVRKQQQILEQLNQVYDGTPDSTTAKIKRVTRRIIKGRW